jgi:N-acyl-D-amino-acid deacylase
MRQLWLPIVAISMLSGTLRAEDRLRPAVERALPLLERASAGSADNRECFTCHSQGLPILALDEARQRGFEIDDANFQRQLDHTYAHLERNRERYAAGKGTGGNADTAGYALWTLSTGDRAPDDTITAVTEYLLTWQSADPHWSCTSHRPPTEASDFTTTYVSLRGLKAFGTDEQQERIAARVETAKAWLIDAPAGDNEDRVFRLWSLHLAEADPQVIASAAGELLSRQGNDGGWSQLDDQAADAYATATALVALHRTSSVQTTDEAYQRGVKYLLDSQLEDGTWHVASRSKPFQTYFETGFPHGTDQFISTSASAWSVLALLAALPAETDPEPPTQ